VKSIKLLFLTLFILFVSGCEDKKEPVVTKSDQNLTQTDTNTTRTIETFTLSDIEDHNYTLTVTNKHIEIKELSEKIILINFFATWCPPCKGEIPYLTDLQKRYENKLFIAGVLVNDTISKEKLQAFIDQYNVNYFISSSKGNEALVELASKKLKLGEDFPIPLSVLFKNGNYYSHYEGAVPVEMLEHDIQKAMSKE